MDRDDSVGDTADKVGFLIDSVRLSHTLIESLKSIYAWICLFFFFFRPYTDPYMYAFLNLM